MSWSLSLEANGALNVPEHDTLGRRSHVSSQSASRARRAWYRSVRNLLCLLASWRGRG